ncbi:hypothetical protein ACET3Z_009894 [Daucus carota]
MEERLGKELVFIASPLMGHLMPFVQLAKLMLNLEPTLSITFILIKLPAQSEVNTFIDTLCSAMMNERLCFVTLPPLEHNWSSTNRGVILDELIQYHKPRILHTISQLIAQHGVDAVVVDLLSSTLIELVADEFGIPGYVFFTSGAGFLGVMLRFQTLEDELEEDTGKLKYATTDLRMPCFVQPVPPAVLPSLLADYATWTARFLRYARGCRKAKGILVNTFQELESYSLSSFSVLDSSSWYGKSSIPEIRAVGPVIYQSTPQDEASDGLMKWLDDQAPSSVVFLCFGSMGSFGVDQVREIAYGIEQSKCPFVWMVKELGLAVEIPATVPDHDYKDKASVDLLIKAESVEKGIRRLILGEDGKVIRGKVAQMKEKSRENMQEGGSSYESLGNFIRNVM